MSLKGNMRYMNPYDVHKALINDYILKRPGDTKLLRRDTSKDRNDFDILREHHKFLWADKAPETWEEQFAKKYYDKLFKEYSIGDLSRYKENKIALRWRTEQEVVLGKGQFICAEKKCTEQEDLRSWEVNFVYQEEGQKKNALVKIRLCPNCSRKLNYYTKKREVLKKKNKLKVKKASSIKKDNLPKESIDNTKQYPKAQTSKTDIEDKNNTQKESSTWENLQPVESKSREEEMEDYLNDLLL
ncbi:protein FRA10AC1 homolog [Agrilus planipennis]|uniref:Protein FRA10AC1 homolog n=1 Tax=Agrilus planipennis TaxID=224129 RepID=A0A7F5R3C5_AGRPL|nr:protein FRA10AC1 homolog [Agrilus planipennis]